MYICRTNGRGGSRGCQAELDKARWNERLTELKMYKDKLGHCDVPTKQGKLGIWVHNQRRRRKRLSKEREDALDELGFS